MPVCSVTNTSCVAAHLTVGKKTQGQLGKFLCFAKRLADASLFGLPILCVEAHRLCCLHQKENQEAPLLRCCFPPSPPKKRCFINANTAEQSSSGWAGIFFFFPPKILIQGLAVTQAARVICMDDALGKQNDLTTAF